MHSTDNVNDGYLGSGKRIITEIKKHGKENFVREILEHLPTREALFKREAEIVNPELLADPLCLNIAPGGNPCGFFSEAQRVKATLSGNRSLKRNHKDAVQKAVKTKQERGTMYVPTGSSGMLGKMHSDETKLQQSTSHEGEKNSQFGTCWVTDSVKAVKIKKDLLDEYLSRGFTRGRKLHHQSPLAD